MNLGNQNLSEVSDIESSFSRLLADSQPDDGARSDGEYPVGTRSVLVDAAFDD